jgi:hypothetical protein
MAKRGKSQNPGYRSGSHWADCFSCGFAFRAEDLKETWDNRWVCDEDFEVRHPQDFLRVRPEKISVDLPILLDNTDNAVTETVDGSGPAVFAETYTVPAGNDFGNGDDIPDL